MKYLLCSLSIAFMYTFLALPARAPSQPSGKGAYIASIRSYDIPASPSDFYITYYKKSVDRNLSFLRGPGKLDKLLPRPQGTVTRLNKFPLDAYTDEQVRAVTANPQIFGANWIAMQWLSASEQQEKVRVSGQLSSDFVAAWHPRKLYGVQILAGALKDKTPAESARLQSEAALNAYQVMTNPPAGLVVTPSETVYRDWDAAAVHTYLNGLPRIEIIYSPVAAVARGSNAETVHKAFVTHAAVKGIMPRFYWLTGDKTSPDVRYQFFLCAFVRPWLCYAPGDPAMSGKFLIPMGQGDFERFPSRLGKFAHDCLNNTTARDPLEFMPAFAAYSMDDLSAKNFNDFKSIQWIPPQKAQPDEKCPCETKPPNYFPGVVEQALLDEWLKDYAHPDGGQLTVDESCLPTDGSHGP